VSTNSYCCAIAIGFTIAIGVSNRFTIAIGVSTSFTIAIGVSTDCYCTDNSRWRFSKSVGCQTSNAYPAVQKNSLVAIVQQNRVVTLRVAGVLNLFGAGECSEQAHDCKTLRPSIQVVENQRNRILLHE
jgi:hypothetical protein